MNSDTSILSDHYQKTYELTLSMWDKRNRTFLFLLAVVGAATLLTFNVAQAEPLLVDLVAKLLGIQDTSRAKELHSSFPYGLVQSILLMVVLYLMVILYHRTATIQRYYKYLACLEADIRSQLNLHQESQSFTRESDFYHAHKPLFSDFVAITYIAMLGILLTVFLSLRIYSDFAGGNYWTGIADLCLACPTLLFFYAYVRSA